MALADTGCGVENPIMREDLFRKVCPKMELAHTSLEVSGADDSPLEVLGQAQNPLTLQFYDHEGHHVNYSCRPLICRNLKLPFIIGAEDIAELDLIPRIRNSTAEINYQGKKIVVPLRKLKDREIPKRLVHNLASYKNVKIEPYTEKVIEGVLEAPKEDQGQLVMFEPDPQYMKDQRLQIASSVDKIREGGRVKLLVMNLNEHPVSINKHKIMGTVHYCKQNKKKRIFTLEAWDKLKTRPNKKRVLRIQVKKSHDFSNREREKLVQEAKKKKGQSSPSMTLKELKQKLVADLRLADVSTLSPEEKKKIVDLFIEFSDILALKYRDIGNCKLFQVELDTGDSKPVKSRMRPTPWHLKQDLKVQLLRWIEQGVIEESNSEWGSAMRPVGKPDGSIRWCVDFRGINKVTKDQVRPVANLQDKLRSLKAGRRPIKYYTTLDLSEAFHSLSIHPDSRPKTSFLTEFGSYQFCRMPFGLKNAPAAWGRVVTALEHDLNTKNPELTQRVLAYFDDLILASENFKELYYSLKTIFEVLRKLGLKIKPSKVELCKSEVRWLGYLVRPEGIKLDPKRIEALKNWGPITTQKHARGINGLMNGFRGHVRGLASRTPNIRKLSSMKEPVWTPQCQAEYEDILEAVTKEPIMRHPDFSPNAAPFIIAVDSSGPGIGATLMQEQNIINEEGKPEAREIIIQYASKRKNPGECHYGSYKSELKGVVDAVQNFKEYLWGREFIIRTDHKGLEFIKNPSNDKMPALAQRWQETLAQFKFRIEYVPATKLKLVDALSRRPYEHDNWGTMKTVPLRDETFPFNDLTEEQANSADPEIWNDYLKKNFKEQYREIENKRQQLAEATGPPKEKRSPEILDSKNVPVKTRSVNKSGKGGQLDVNKRNINVVRVRLADLHVVSRRPPKLEKPDNSSKQLVVKNKLDKSGKLKLARNEGARSNSIKGREEHKTAAVDRNLSSEQHTDSVLDLADMSRRNTDRWTNQPPDSMEWEDEDPVPSPGLFMEELKRLQRINKRDPEASRIIGRLSGLHQQATAKKKHQRLTARRFGTHDAQQHPKSRLDMDEFPEPIRKVSPNSRPRKRKEPGMRDRLYKRKLVQSVKESETRKERLQGWKFHEKNLLEERQRSKKEEKKRSKEKKRKDPPATEVQTSSEDSGQKPKKSKKDKKEKRDKESKDKEKNEKRSEKKKGKEREKRPLSEAEQKVQAKDLIKFKPSARETFWAPNDQDCKKVRLINQLRGKQINHKHKDPELLLDPGKGPLTRLKARKLAETAETKEALGRVMAKRRGIIKPDGEVDPDWEFPAKANKPPEEEAPMISDYPTDQDHLIRMGEITYPEPIMERDEEDLIEEQSGSTKDELETMTKKLQSKNWALEQDKDEAILLIKKFKLGQLESMTKKKMKDLFPLDEDDPIKLVRNRDLHHYLDQLNFLEFKEDGPGARRLVRMTHAFQKEGTMRTRIFVAQTILPRHARNDFLLIGHFKYHWKTLANYTHMRTRVYWPNMLEDIKLTVRSCDICQDKAPRKQDMGATTSLSYRRCEDFSMDVVYLPQCKYTKHGYLCTVLDLSTRFLFAFPLRNQKAKNLIKVVDQITSLFGEGLRFHVDQGRNFLSKELTDYVIQQGCETIKKEAYNPQSAPVERYHKILKGALAIQVKAKNLPHNQWDLVLHEALRMCRNLPDAGGVSPAMRLFGKIPQEQLDLHLGINPNDNFEIEDQIAFKDEALERLVEAADQKKIPANHPVEASDCLRDEEMEGNLAFSEWYPITYGSNIYLRPVHHQKAMVGTIFWKQQPIHNLFQQEDTHATVEWLQRKKDQEARATHETNLKARNLGEKPKMVYPQGSLVDVRRPIDHSCKKRLKPFARLHTGPYLVLAHNSETRKVKVTPFDKVTMQPLGNCSGSWENEDSVRPTLTFARDRYGGYIFPSVWDESGTPIGAPKRKGTILPPSTTEGTKLPYSTINLHDVKGKYHCLNCKVELDGSEVPKHWTDYEDHLVVADGTYSGLKRDRPNMFKNQTVGIKTYMGSGEGTSNPAAEKMAEEEPLQEEPLQDPSPLIQVESEEPEIVEILDEEAEAPTEPETSPVDMEEDAPEEPSSGTPAETEEPEPVPTAVEMGEPESENSDSSSGSSSSSDSDSDSSSEDSEMECAPIPNRKSRRMSESSTDSVAPKRMKLRSAAAAKKVKLRSSDTAQINKRMKHLNMPNIEEEVSLSPTRPRDPEEELREMLKEELSKPNPEPKN